MRRLLIILVAFISCSNNVLGFDDSQVTIHGFASTGYLKSNHYNYLVTSEAGSFQFNEAGINLHSTVSDNMRIGVQLYSFKLGNVGNNDVKLDWAFLDYSWKEAIGIRVGKIKTPYGLYNEAQDYDMLHTNVLLPQGIYNKLIRDTLISTQGGNVYGRIDAGPVGGFAYDLSGGSMHIDDDGATATLISSTQQGLSLTSVNVNYVYGGRVKWYTPVNGLLFAGTIQRGDIDYKATHETHGEGDLTTPDVIFWIASAEYSLGNLTASSEYSQMDFNMDLDFQTLPMTLENKNETESWYVMLSYRFNKWFEAGTYYSVYYPNRNDKNGRTQDDGLIVYPDYNGWQKEIVISTRFDINDNWLFKFETHFIDGIALTIPADNDYSCDKRDWILFAVKTTFNF